MKIIFKENKREDCYQVFLNNQFGKEDRIATIYHNCKNKVIISTKFAQRINNVGDDPAEIKKNILVEFNKFILRELTEEQIRIMKESMQSIIVLSNAFTEHLQNLDFLEKIEKFSLIGKEVRLVSEPINKFAMSLVKSLAIENMETMCDLADEVNIFIKEKLNYENNSSIFDIRFR